MYINRQSSLGLRLRAAAAAGRGAGGGTAWQPAMASLFERVLALPAWAWFVAAFASNTLGSQTWYWMLAMPFVSLIRQIYDRRTVELGVAEPQAAAATEAEAGGGAGKKSD
eukprot:COSAG06_NODE_9077_length_1994_cov_1.440633_2_plen_111_part_00